jgi:glycosyltransferase involved in cell wall biosynthesis
MSNQPIHIVYVMANNSSVPYFLWFAERASKKDKYKFSFILLHSERPKMIEEVAQFGCECYWIHFDNKSRGRSMIKAIPKLYFLLKNLRPDVVHSHLFDDSLCTVIASKLAGIKNRFVTKQDTTFHWFYAKKAVKYDRLINRLATHLVPVSKECKEFVLENEGADPNKVHLVHHGIPKDKLSLAKEEYKKELIEKYGLKDKIVIGTVARLIEWKGHKTLIEVAEKAVKINPDIVFLFAGEGDLKEELQEIINQKNLTKNIVFTGWVDRKKIPSLYAIMDIYIHAAKYEPFGFVIAEAMMNGAPVLSTKTGSALDAIKHRVNGFLVDYDSIDGFVEGIEFLLNSNRKEIGQKGLETAKEMYSFDRMWKGYTSLYDRTLKLNKELPHVVHIMANNSYAPYLTWFAQEAARRKDVRFTFVCMFNKMPDMLFEMRRLGCDSHWIKYDTQHKKVHQVKSLFQLFFYLKKVKPNAVNTHLLEDSLPGLLAAKWAGIKTRIITKGDAAYHWYYAKKWVFLDKLNNTNASHIVAISNESKEFILEKEKANPKKVMMIHHGIPIDKILSSVKLKKKEQFLKLYNSNNNVLIGSVARYVEWKGFQYIIDAAEVIAKKHPNVTFLFVGVGQNKEEIEAMFKARNITNIKLASWIYPEDLPSLYACFDMFIHAAVMEPFGFVIAEAMAHGLPVISSPTGAAKDAIKHLENGYLTRYKDSSSIVEGIEHMLSNDTTQIKRNVQETAKNMYDFTIMYNNYLKLYKDSLNN